MGFRSADLETQYLFQRNTALRRHDENCVLFAWFVNVVFNIIMVSENRAVWAAAMYTLTLMAQTAAMKLLTPAAYAANRNLILCCCRFSYHLSTWLGFVSWSAAGEPPQDNSAFNSASEFFKLLIYVSGVVALLWLHICTSVSSMLPNFFVQSISSLPYILYYAPRVVCPAVLLSQQLPLMHLWRFLNSAAASLSQVVLLGAGSTAASHSHCLTPPGTAAAGAEVPGTSPPEAGSCNVISMESSCLQTVVFAQILLGVALPCGAAWLNDRAARRQFLTCCWQQQAEFKRLWLEAQGPEGSSRGQLNSAEQQQHRQTSPHSSGHQAAAAAAGGGMAANSDDFDQQLVDHPLEYVVNFKVLSVCSVYLVVGLWLLLGEMVGGLNKWAAVM